MLEIVEIIATTFLWCVVAACALLLALAILDSIDKKNQNKNNNRKDDE